MVASSISCCEATGAASIVLRSGQTSKGTGDEAVMRLGTTASTAETVASPSASVAPEARSPDKNGSRISGRQTAIVGIERWRFIARESRSCFSESRPTATPFEVGDRCVDLDDPDGECRIPLVRRSRVPDQRLIREGIDISGARGHTSLLRIVFQSAGDGSRDRRSRCSDLTRFGNHALTIQ